MVIMDLDKKGQKILITSPYDVALKDAIKEIPGRVWNPELKKWVIPLGEISFAIKMFKRTGWEYKVTARLRECVVADKERKEAMLRLKFQDDADFDAPGFRSTLRPFQNVGALFLVTAKRAVLGDDMGLGKSIQALAAAANLKAERTLVLVPGTLLDNWEEEILKHVPGHLYYVVDGKPAERQALWEQQPDEPAFWVTNYEKLLHDWEVMPHRWDVIIADEVSARIKNYRAQQTKKLKRLKAEYRWGLTGTPIENALVEFHSVMDWIEPGLLGPGSQFIKRYGIKDEMTGRIIGYRNIEEVQLKVSPYLIRRTKEEVLPELPEKIVNDYHVKLSAAERAEYKRATDDFEEWWGDTTGEFTWGDVLTKIVRLKQLTGHPRLLGLDMDSSKLEELKNILVELRGHKVVVFTQFKQIAYMMSEELDEWSTTLRSGKRQHKIFTMTGDHKKKKKNEIKHAFEDHEGSALLIMTEVGAYGLNLQCADYIIHYDFPWNPARLRQREDRLHRMGQKNVVNVINLIATDTIDEYIWDVLYDKESLAQGFLAGTKSEVIFERLGRSTVMRLVRGRKRKRRVREAAAA